MFYVCCYREWKGEEKGKLAEFKKIQSRLKVVVIKGVRISQIACVANCFSLCLQFIINLEKILNLGFAECLFFVFVLLDVRDGWACYILKFFTYPTKPGRPCIICIIRRSRARNISSFFFLSDGGLAKDT